MYRSRVVMAGIGASVLLGAVLLAAETGHDQTKTPDTPAAESRNAGHRSADRVQVYLFHSTERCSTCITIGRLAGETVNEFYQPELRSGKIEFREINVDLPENAELARKFQAGGTALFINAIADGKDNIAEDTRVWRLTGDEAGFKSYLRGKLDDLFRE